MAGENEHPDDGFLQSQSTRKALASFADLLWVVKCLRGPRGCPWDKRQTPQSIKRYLIEEAYEVIDAIDRNDHPGLCGELGDVFFQVLFQTALQEDRGTFDLTDVLSSTYRKMIRRHPHVFGEKAASSEREIKKNWSRIKRHEERRDHYFDAQETTLPALQHSHKIGSLAASLGFDWDNPDHVLEKIQEEIQEARSAEDIGDRRKLAEELGDVLFAVSNWLRKYGFEPEETLRAANRKFIARFTKMEKLARDRGLNFESLTMDEKEALWQETKRQQGD